MRLKSKINQITQTTLSFNIWNYRLINEILMFILFKCDFKNDIFIQIARNSINKGIVKICFQFTCIYIKPLITISCIHFCFYLISFFIFFRFIQIKGKNIFKYILKNSRIHVTSLDYLSICKMIFIQLPSFDLSRAI